MRALLLAGLVVISGCAAKSSAPVANAANEARVQVCVVDTIAPGGMMTISAIHNTATNDTLVLQSTGRVHIDSVVAGPKSWKTGPIQLRTTAGTVRFNPSGSPKTFGPGKIALLGVLNGLPIFANPAEVSPMRAEIEALAASGIDLDQALVQRLTLRRRMDRIRTVYAPTSLVNCTFQTFTRPAQRRR